MLPAQTQHSQRDVLHTNKNLIRETIFCSCTAYNTEITTASSKKETAAVVQTILLEQHWKVQTDLTASHFVKNECRSEEVIDATDALSEAFKVVF